MYELFTLGGGDLPGRPAERRGRDHLGRRLCDAGPARRGGRGWLGSVPDGLRRLVEGQRQVVAAVRDGLGGDDRAQGDGPRGRPAGPGARAGGGRQRAHRARAVRLADQPGRRRSHAADRTGLHPAGRSRLPAPRAHIRGQARGGDDAAGNHRRGVRTQHQELCPAVRVPRPAARPYLGRRSEGKHRHLGAGHRRGHAVDGRLARAHVRVRDPPGGGRHRGDADRPRDRHLPDRRGETECAVERGDRPGRHDLRTPHLPGLAHRGAGARRAAGGAAGRARLPDRRLPFGGRDHAPADGAERGPRRRRAMGGRGRQRGGAPGLYRSARRGPDRLGLPGHRPSGRDLGAAAQDRLRMPLYRRLPDGGAADADACGRGDIPLIRHRADLAAELGAALRRAAPDLHGGSRGKNVGGGGDAGRRYRHLAGRPGRHTGGGVRRRGDVGLSLHVGAVPRRSIGLRALQGDCPGHVRAGGRPGRRVVRRP